MAPFWVEVPPAVQIKLAKIPFTAIKAGLREAEETADRRALKLADEEHAHRRLALVKIADGLDASVAEVEASGTTEIEEAHVLKLRARSTRAAATAGDEDHAKQVAHLSPQPRASALTGMHHTRK